MYCEACGAANEPTAEQCFACQQAFIDENIEGVESAQAPTANDGDNRDAALDSRLAAGSLLQERYKIVQEVGTGGFGSVYRASDTLFGNRMVAIKEIRLQGLKPNEVIDATDTFNREASILSELRHPNLPRIYDSFTAPEHWYLVMDFIDGETLETYLDKIGGRLLPDEVLEIGIQLCTVLDYLHSRQTPVIFRDLKPTNIMMTAYKQVYLIDFGAARYFKPGRSRDTIAFGSPGYASPEQYGKAQTTARSDIYSLGATLHEVLTGKDPGETPFKFSFSPRMAGVTIPPDLEDLILRMVEMDASKRPASAKAVKEELQRISMQHLRRLYPLPGPMPSSAIYQPPYTQGQPPPASWATSAPSVRQAQMQLGLPPTPTAPKRNITRRALTTMILLGIAGAALVENSRWIWSQPADPYAPAQAMQTYSLSQQGTFNGHKESVTSLAWSDKMSLVASSSKDGTVKVWNPFSYETYATHTLSHAQVNGVTWSPGGSYVAATSSNKVHPVAVWGNSGQTDAAPTTYSGPALGAMNAIAWAPYYSMLATGGEDAVVRILEQDGSALKHTVSYVGHKGQVQSLAWSNDAYYLASASADKTVRVWATAKRDAATIRDAKYTFEGHMGSVYAVEWMSTVGTNSIISGGADKTIHIWDAFSDEILQTYKMLSAVRAIAWSASNGFFAAGLTDGSLYLYQPFEPEPLYIFQGNGTAIRSLAWSPDGTALVSGSDNGSATVWHLEQMQRHMHHGHWH